MPFQTNIRALPRVIAGLAAIQTIVRPAVRDRYGLHSCISTVRAGLEVLRRLDVAARPVAVETFVFNAAFVTRARELDRLPRDRAESDRWFEEVGAHSIGITGLAQANGRHWAGHLCILLENQLLVDASLDQIARPAYGIVPPPLLLLETDAAFREGRVRLADTHLGAEFVYRCYPDDRGYEQREWFDRPFARQVARDALKWARRTARAA